MDCRDLLTAEQISEMFGYSIDSLKKNFSRIVASIKKKYGIILSKTKVDKKIFYLIVKEDSRALTIYDETENIAITIESLSLQALEFLIFLTLAASFNGTYRGTKENLLKYIGAKSDKKHLEKLDRAIAALKQKKYILDIDIIDEGYITLILRREIEKEFNIKIQMLKECRKIAEDNHSQFKRLAQLIQVWEAIRICERKQPFTYNELQKITGLSYKQIREIKRLLEGNEIFKMNRVGNYWRCFGMNVELNGFYDNNIDKNQRQM